MNRIILSIIFSLTFFFSNAREDISISIFTTAQGNDIYELEGHAALRIRKGNDIDCVINWGLFDFNSPNFVYRFVKGENDYKCGAMPTEYFLESYAREGRTVFEHYLNIPQDAAQKVYDLVSVNLTPPNDVYRYNYVYDNCATRPMAILEKAIGDTISYTDSDKDLNTFRKVMAHFHKNYPWYQFGIDLALGSGIDKKITAREKIFAPVLLNKIIENSTYTLDGKTIRLSDGKHIYGDINRSIIEAPTPFFLTPLFVSLIVMLISIMMSIRDYKKKRINRMFDTAIYVPVILCSLLLTFLIFVSSHEATSPNFNYLWLNPLSILILAGIWIKRAKKLAISSIIINFVTLIAYIMVISFGIQEANIAFLPIIITILLRNITYISIARWQKVNNI